ncbi:MAG: AIR synthase family protein [Thermodesulfovibrionia bacterium]|nr:AIR synthase family protein [Thermodesulfovibrionia bacterium]
MKNNPDHHVLPVGKLPSDILARMLKTYTSLDERVQVGPSVGEDAAVIDMGDRYLLIKTDPITFVAEDIGTYTVRINANDIATMGGKPKWLLTSILLPEKHTTTELVEEIFQQLSYACKEIGVSLCGGHTEITAGIDKLIVVGAMLGEVEKDGLITTSGALAGDDILLTKAIAVEGTSIIARQKEKELKAIFDIDFVLRCKGFIESPGISIMKEAEIATRYGDIHSMHDPTEGGLATGLYEIACAADVGLFVEEERIPVFSECKSLCRHFGLDPLGLIASGSLLITLNPEDTEKVLDALRNNGISATWIGKVLPKEDGLKIKKRNKVLELPFFERDEITKIFV